jgi:predicted enzyme involved in methoxymalonyl-ACP biosynthesis
VQGETLDLILWLMSCRVLKRDMELAMLDTLADNALRRGITALRGHYFPSAKNAMVKEFYGTLGFEKLGEDESGNSEWLLSLEGYEKRNGVIRVSEDAEG